MDSAVLVSFMLTVFYLPFFVVLPLLFPFLVRLFLFPLLSFLLPFLGFPLYTPCVLFSDISTLN